MRLPNFTGDGSMCGRSVASSDRSSMSKKTAPGMCAERYSTFASRPVCGRYQEASAMRMSGAFRCFASHSVETSGFSGVIAPKDYSISCTTRRSRKWDYITHIPDAGNISDSALKTQTEARVRYSAIAAQIAIPTVVLLVDAVFGHARIQNVEPFLALTAADDFTDARGKHVHCRDGTA